VARKGEFFDQIENPSREVTIVFFQKNSLKMAELLRDAQHLLRAQVCAIHENGEAVAGIRIGGKDITMDEVEHLIGLWHD
jgi:hypothetical protein